MSLMRGTNGRVGLPSALARTWASSVAPRLLCSRISNLRACHVTTVAPQIRTLAVLSRYNSNAKRRTLVSTPNLQQQGNQNQTASQDASAESGTLGEWEVVLDKPTMSSIIQGFADEPFHLLCSRSVRQNPKNIEALKRIVDEERVKAGKKQPELTFLRRKALTFLSAPYTEHLPGATSPQSSSESKKDSDEPEVSSDALIYDLTLHGQLTPSQIKKAVQKAFRDETLTPAQERQLQEEASLMREAGLEAYKVAADAFTIFVIVPMTFVVAYKKLLELDESLDLLLAHPATKAAAAAKAKQLHEEIEAMAETKRANSFLWRTFPKIEIYSRVWASRTHEQQVYDAALDAFLKEGFISIFEKIPAVRLILLKSFEKLAEEALKKEGRANLLATKSHVLATDAFVNTFKTKFKGDWENSFTKKYLESFDGYKWYLREKEKENEREKKREEKEKEKESGSQSDRFRGYRELLKLKRKKRWWLF